jgi:hypothetical protein
MHYKWIKAICRSLNWEWIARNIDLYIQLFSFVEVLGYLDVYNDQTLSLDSKLCLAPLLSMLVDQCKSLNATHSGYTFWHLLLILNENRHLLAPTYLLKRMTKSA